MIKLIIFGAIIGLVVGQLPQSFMMMQMLNNMGGGFGNSNGQGNSGTSGNSQGEGDYMNNALLCRNTRNLAYVPCANMPNVCNIISMRTYQMPNLLKCSALGTGCCLRDVATMFLAGNLGAS